MLYITLNEERITIFSNNKSEEKQNEKEKIGFLSQN